MQALLNDKAKMVEVLKYHVVPGATLTGNRIVKMIDDASGKASYKTLQGEKMNATLVDGSVAVNGVPVEGVDVQGGKVGLWAGGGIRGAHRQGLLEQCAWALCEHVAAGFRLAATSDHLVHPARFNPARRSQRPAARQQYPHKTQPALQVLISKPHHPPPPTPQVMIHTISDVLIPPSLMPAPASKTAAAGSAATSGVTGRALAAAALALPALAAALL